MNLHYFVFRALPFQNFLLHTWLLWHNGPCWGRILKQSGPMVIQMIDAKVEVLFSLHFTRASRNIHAGFQLRIPSFLNENIHWHHWRGFFGCLLAFCVVFWSNISPKIFINFCKMLKPIKCIRNLNGLLAVISIFKCTEIADWLTNNNKNKTI